MTAYVDFQIEAGNLTFSKINPNWSCW